MIPVINKYLFYYPALLYGSRGFLQYRKQLDESQWHDTTRIQEEQIRRLVSLLNSAKESVPYYSDILRSVNTASFSSPSDIQGIPLLTKDDLKSNFHRLHQPNLKNALEKTTGGSTGNPVTVYRSRSAMGAGYAADWRGYQWAGVKIGERQARFWGVPNTTEARRMARLKDLVANRFRCSAFAFDEAELAGYYRALNRFKPRYFYGYVSMLEAFAKYIIKYDLKLDFQLRCIISTSEVLTSVHRRLLETVFNCAVYNEYGCGEVGSIAHECEEGSMHVHAENLIVEICKNGKVCELGESGDIVVTDIRNASMPLIRYNLGDIGYLSSQSCSCGRRLPVLGGLAGRAYDTIFNRDGKAFHGEYFMYIFEDLQKRGLHVASFQVIQVSHDEFHIKLVMDHNHRRELEEFVAGRVRETYGSYAKFTFEYVSGIEREKSGKIRLIKTLLRSS